MKSHDFPVLCTILMIFFVCSSCKQNTPPVTSLIGESDTFVGDSILLDGSGSSDADNDSLIYTWSIVAGPENAEDLLLITEPGYCLFIPDVGGNYTVELRVNDGSVDGDSVTVDIEVTGFHGKWALQSLLPKNPNIDAMLDTVIYGENGSYEYHSYYKLKGKIKLTFIGKGTQEKPGEKVQYTEYSIESPLTGKLETFTKDHDPYGSLSMANSYQGSSSTEFVLSEGGNTLTTKYDGNRDGDYDDIQSFTGTSDFIQVWKRIE